MYARKSNNHHPDLSIDDQSIRGPVPCASSKSRGPCASPDLWARNHRFRPEFRTEKLVAALGLGVCPKTMISSASNERSRSPTWLNHAGTTGAVATDRLVTSMP